jgi:hypothetical protein
MAAGISLFLLVVLDGARPAPSPAAHDATPTQTQRAGKIASPHVGAAMAVLATLEQARVLPPEGTKDADRVIKSVIQLQSVFAKSTDPAVREFLRRAVGGKGDGRTEQVLEQFQSSGWTPDVLEALADAAMSAQAEDIESLSKGLGSFNLSVEDFRQFMRLVKDGERALASDGRTFHEVFLSQRRMMPGADR